MQRTKLADRVLPTYTKGEEIFNMTSHIVGGGLGIIGMILCIIVSAKHHNVYGIISSIIYGISLILLYTISSIYHGLSPKLKGKKVLQILDHCSIYILIAGCYTPVVLCSIRRIDSTLAWWIFGIVWSLAVIGIVLNSIDLKSTRVFSMVCYILMGWCIIFKFNVLMQAVATPGIILLVAGGVIYTIGTIFYGLGRKIEYFHSIFHLLIVLGSILQFFCILLYVL